MNSHSGIVYKDENPFKHGHWITPYGKVVNLMNSKPVNYSQGGMIKWEKNQYNPLHNDLTHDNKPVLLEIGSLVIPKSVVPIVVEFQRKNGKMIQPQIKDKSKLTVVIVMPEEMIVPKKYADIITRHLLTHGITLPLKQTNLFE